MLRWRFVCLITIVFLVLGTVAFAQEILPGIPRNEVIVIEDPSGRSLDPGRFNLWGGGLLSYSTGLQQLCLGALWYIDPDEGIEGDPWINLLAAEPPIYNEDYTEMTVKVREGIHWGDGVPFTIDDVIYTVELLKAHPEMIWGAYMQVNVAESQRIDDFTVKFKLTKPMEGSIPFLQLDGRLAIFCPNISSKKPKILLLLPLIHQLEPDPTF